MKRLWRAAMTGMAVAAALVISFGRPDAQPEKVAAGATLYADYCASCHGEELRNTSGGVTFDLRRLRAADRDRFFAVVLNGKSPMPPWRGVLQLSQIESIWAYIRATVDR